jgi:hypothetical protein
MLNLTNTYPAYLDKFSDLYSQLPEAERLNNHLLLNQGAWNLAIFSHAVKNKEFRLAMGYLEKVSLCWTHLPSEDQAQEAYQKLITFTENLQKQFERFLDKKMRAD